MFCKNCGKELPDDAKFCIYCGKKLIGDFTSDYSGSQSQSKIFYVLLLLKPGSLFNKCQRLLMSKINCSGLTAETILQILNRGQSVFVLCIENQLDVIKNFSKPFEELNCSVRILESHKEPMISIGQMINVSNSTSISIDLLEQRSKGLPKCPICGSYLIREIELKDRRIMSSGLNGASKARGKSMICGMCGFTI